MHFINLTQFNNFTREISPVFINVELVTQLAPRQLKLQAKSVPAQKVGGGNDYSLPPVETHPAVDLNLTCISFCVGLGEDVDAIYVVETIAEILEKL